jgi:hypothetical protein
LSMYVIPAKAGIHNKEPADVQYLSLRVIIPLLKAPGFIPGVKFNTDRTMYGRP